MTANSSAKRVVTYSPSFTLPLTHACANRCLYCGFRKPDAGLMAMEEVAAGLDRARERQCSEVLIISGERVNDLPLIHEELRTLGLKNFGEYVLAVSRDILKRGLLPHTNIGILEYSELARLREVNASLGLMLENSDREWGKKTHPQKDIAKRIETIKNAGRLKIPFTTGILVGLGESRASRWASLSVIAELHREYGHIQEVILQNYVPNEQSALSVFPLSIEEWKDLILFCRREMPGVKIQIPPNLNLGWIDLISFGADDLGGISADQDFVNPKNPWKEMAVYARELSKQSISLIPRLPIYPEFYRQGWYADGIKGALARWVERDEFRYYLQ